MPHDVAPPARGGGPNRRTVMAWLAGAAAAAIGAVLAVPGLGHLLAPARRRGGAPGVAPGTRQAVGRLADFPTGRPTRVELAVTFRDGWSVRTANESAWIVRGADGGVLALSATCPHLGCSIGLDPTGTAFACPCHDSEFGPDGERRLGPARRGLDPLPVSVEAGVVHVEWVDHVPGIAERRPVGRPT